MARTGKESFATDYDRRRVLDYYCHLRSTVSSVCLSPAQSFTVLKGLFGDVYFALEDGQYGIQYLEKVRKSKIRGFYHRTNSLKMKQNV